MVMVMRRQPLFLIVVVSVVILLSSFLVQEVSGWSINNNDNNNNHHYGNDISSSSSSVSSSNTDRRTFLNQATASASVTSVFLAGIGVPLPQPVQAAASSTASIAPLIQELEECKEKLAPIPDLLQEKEWDKVRTILKLPPVNKLWNLGDSQNTLLQIAKQTDNIDLLELKDELSITLQLCDQYTYDNAFVYFQPGSGKFNIKEPTELSKKAMRQIQQAIELANE